jgi:hypothetical protein
MQIELTAEEATLLREVVGTALSDLRMELAGTDSAGYREMLHRRREVMQRILTALGPEPEPSDASGGPVERRGAPRADLGRGRELRG